MDNHNSQIDVITIFTMFLLIATAVVVYSVILCIKAHDERFYRRHYASRHHFNDRYDVRD